MYLYIRRVAITIAVQAAEGAIYHPHNGIHYEIAKIMKE